MARHSKAASLAFRRQAETIQRARDSLSIEKFLNVLSQVALNGTMPRYDKRGNLIPEDEPEVVEPKLRLQTTQYLVDKVMSNPAPVQATGSSEDVLDDDAVKKLSNEELRAIASAALQEAVSRSLPQPRPHIEQGSGTQETGGTCSVGGDSPPGTDTPGSA